MTVHVLLNKRTIISACHVVPLARYQTKTSITKSVRIRKTCACICANKNANASVGVEAFGPVKIRSDESLTARVHGIRSIAFHPKLNADFIRRIKVLGVRYSDKIIQSVELKGLSDHSDAKTRTVFKTAMIRSHTVF